MVAELSILDLKIINLINSKHLSCGLLAKELKVSRATAAKFIALLRKKGFPISATRNANEWFYRIEPQQDPELGKLIGTGGRGAKNYSMTIHELLVEQINARSKNKKEAAG
jgi:biotin operon repressor